jgi:lipopolysaccharide transport system ATP-binding protein
VDEVLAVGDAEFQKKCLGKMKDVAGHGRTILFVSHNMVAVQNLCTRGCLFHNGTIVYQGDINSVVSKYAALHQSLVPESRGKQPNQVLAASRDGSIRLTKFEFLDDAGNAIDSPRCGDNVTFSIGVQMTTELKNATLLISVNDQFGTRITQLNSEFAGTLIHLKEGSNSITCRIESLPLSPRDYSLDLKILNKNECLLLAEGFSSLNVQAGDFYGTGKMPDTQWSGILCMKSEWLGR